MGWLIALLILLAVILVIAALLSVWVRLTVRIDGGTEIRLKFLFFNFRLIPGKKKKKPKPRDFKIHRFRKLQEKKRQKALRRAEKLRRKREKKEKKSGKPPEEEKKKSLLPEAVTENLALIQKLLSLFAAWLKTSLRIDLSLLDIRVASEDAAKTALLYGTVSQSAACFLTILTENTHFRYTTGAIVRVYPDFVAGETQMRLKLTVRLRIRHVLLLAVKAGILYLKS